jgi:hypothetical protein
MRIKSHWFKEGKPKSPEEIADAAAFIVWRIAQNSLKTMRAANFDLPPGPRYFAFMAEFLAFLALGADRFAHRRGDAAWRLAFTTTLANRVGRILAENESDLLGAESADDVRGRFIAIVNECAKESEPFEWTAEGPDYAFLCFLGHRVADIMTDPDRTWAISQVIEVEAPEAAANLHRGMAGLLDEAPRRRERGARATGE